MPTLIEPPTKSQELALIAARQESANRWLETIARRIGDRPLSSTIRAGVMWGMVLFCVVVFLANVALFFAFRAAIQAAASGSPVQSAAPVAAVDKERAAIELRTLWMKLVLQRREAGLPEVDPNDPFPVRSPGVSDASYIDSIDAWISRRN